MKRFHAKLEDLCQGALDSIKKSVKDSVVLATEEDLENDENLLYELPIISSVGKWGDYNEYAILSVENRDGTLIAHTQGKGESSDEQPEFDLAEIDNSNLCWLADMIADIL